MARYIHELPGWPGFVRNHKGLAGRLVKDAGGGGSTSYNLPEE